MEEGHAVLEKKKQQPPTLGNLNYSENNNKNLSPTVATLLKRNATKYS